MSSIAPVQIRAARAMLDWSMTDLSKAAGVSVSTIKRFEDGRSAPVSDDTVAKMQGAVEAQGVRFLADDGNGLGVRFRRR